MKQLDPVISIKYKKTTANRPGTCKKQWKKDKGTP